MLCTSCYFQSLDVYIFTHYLYVLQFLYIYLFNFGFDLGMELQKQRDFLATYTPSVLLTHTSTIVYLTTLYQNFGDITVRVYRWWVVTS